MFNLLVSSIIHVITYISMHKHHLDNIIELMNSDSNLGFLEILQKSGFWLPNQAPWPSFSFLPSLFLSILSCSCVEFIILPLGLMLAENHLKLAKLWLFIHSLFLWQMLNTNGSIKACHFHHIWPNQNKPTY